MITELTKEQEDLIPVYRDRWLAIGLCTDPVDMSLAVPAVKKCYECAGLPAPTAFFGPYNNPIECAKAQAWVKRLPEDTDLTKLDKLEIPEGTEFTVQEISTAISEQVYGYNEASWLAFYAFFKEAVGVPKLESIEGLIEAAKNIGWWAPYDKVAFIQHRPEEIHIENDRLHCATGPAIKFRGDDTSCNIWRWKGIAVSEKIIKKQFCAGAISKENNAEVRRAMLEIYGEINYLQDTNAEVVSTDEFGTLYRAPIEGDEPLMMVKVVNSTLEADGSTKDYFLRVPPTMTTAKEAVAWTFDLRPGEYIPLVET